MQTDTPDTDGSSGNDAHTTVNVSAGESSRDLAKLGALLYAAAIIVFVAIVAAPYVRMAPARLLNWAADDGFYYLQIARHIAQGDGSTFDGIAPTNGYQPGWMFFVTILARIFHNRVLLLHATVALEFGFQILSSILIVILLRPVVGGLWAWIGGVLWLFNPLAIEMTLCMTESPLYVAATILALLAVQRAMRESDTAGAITARNLALVGAALAAALYGRTDAIFLAMTTFVLLVIRQTRSTTLATFVRITLRTLGIVGGACLICLLPWFAYSWVSVHTLAQDSGVIKSLWQQPTIAGMSAWQLLSMGARVTWSGWITGSAIVMLGAQPLPINLALLIVGTCWLASIAVVGREKASGEAVRWTFWLGATTIATGFAYAIGIAGRQLWHLAEPAVVIWLVVFTWIALLLSIKAPKMIQAVAGSAIAVGAAVIWLMTQAVMPPRYPWQVDVYASQPQFERLIPPNARIGCFNAGIPAYFSDRTVTNLDGLVNHDAVPYWQAHQFSRYVHDAHIGYIADEQYSLAVGAYFSRVPLKLQIVAVHPLSDPTRPVRFLLRVMP